VALSRYARHVIDILASAAEGRTARASGLAAEHLHDFPADPLIGLVAVQLATACDG
jgi:hypothetical protein